MGWCIIFNYGQVSGQVRRRIGFDVVAKLDNSIIVDRFNVQQMRPTAWIFLKVADKLSRQ